MADFLEADRGMVTYNTDLTRELRWPCVPLARLRGATARAVFFTNVRVARYRNSRHVGDKCQRMQSLRSWQGWSGRQRKKNVIPFRPWGEDPRMMSRPTSGSLPFMITAATPPAGQPCSPGSGERAGVQPER